MGKVAARITIVTVELAHHVLAEHIWSLVRANRDSSAGPVAGRLSAPHLCPGLSALDIPVQSGIGTG